MNELFEKYKNERENLLKQMETAVSACDTATFEDLKTKVEELDTKFETNKYLNETMQQLQGKELEAGCAMLNSAVMEVNNIEVNTEVGGIDMGTFGNEIKNTTNVLENAFANKLMGVQLSNEETQAFNNIVGITPSEDGVTPIPDSIVYRIYDAVKALCPLVADVKPELGDNNTTVFRIGTLVDAAIKAEGADYGETDDNDSVVPVRVDISDIVKTIKFSTRTGRIFKTRADTNNC